MDQGLSAFLEEIARRKINLFGINIYQHGAMVAQHYLAPDEPRNIYSASKSFAVTAIGILIDEGRLHMEDRPVDFFPEHLPDRLSAGYKKLNLHHLLTMSSGHSRGLLQEDERSNLTETDWIRFVFSQPLVSKPGERFMYSNGSSYLAGCMAEKVSGSKLIDFVYERMFKAMNIPYPVWDECPMGHTFTASRLRLKLSDMIKLGALYLNSGQYQSTQIVSKHWVNTATTRKIASVGSGEDERHGYGYQFWMCRYPDIYLAYGRKGQYIIVLPQKDAVIATSADEERSQSLLNIIWDKILPNL
jgi:CubicO group peptidase (beta-lactamase class C family)